MGVTALWLVRHGESLANVAASVAERGQHEVVAAPALDADVELSATGIHQATALGAWLAALEVKPAAAFSSPYVRAEQTLLIAMQAAGVAVPTGVDERLRDRELGILDLLTRWGVEKRHPEEAARKDWHGKFYYRPPGGESWADVALRVRFFLSELDARGIDGDVLIASHDAVVMLFLYVCLGMREGELLDFAQTHSVLNASVTRLARTEQGWTLEAFSSAEHLAAVGAPVTEHSGDPDVQPH